MTNFCRNTFRDMHLRVDRERFIESGMVGIIIHLISDKIL